MGLFQAAPTIAVDTHQAEEYDERQERLHGVEFSSMRNGIVDNIRRPSEDQIRILDCGTGTGDIALRVAKKFLHSSVVGIDASEKYLEVFRSKIIAGGYQDRVFSRNVDLRLGVPIDFGPFDYAVSQYVFHYDFDRVKLFKSIFDVLKPSGGLLFGVVIPSEDKFENAKYWLQIERNSFEWYKNHGFGIKESTLNAIRDRLWLMTYSNAHGATDLFSSWIEDLRKAGFVDCKCLWRVSMDTIISAVRPPL